MLWTQVSVGVTQSSVLFLTTKERLCHVCHHSGSFCHNGLYLETCFNIYWCFSVVRYFSIVFGFNHCSISCVAGSVSKA